jgi:hypothetical protein
VKNPDYLSRLVIITHTQDDFECPSPRDYVDTKSCLAYEQNRYSTHWVMSGYCHRETPLGYNILPAITQERAKKNISLLHDATTTRYSKLGGCATLLHQIQPWVTPPSPTWIDSNIVSMTPHIHRATVMSPRQHHRQHDSAAPSPAWLDIYIKPQPSGPGSTVTSKTRQHRRKHDSISKSRSSQVITAAPSPA